jgi:hypothetical protein
LSVTSKLIHEIDSRRFMLRNLKDFGFGKASMESVIQEEMAKLCTKLSELTEVATATKSYIEDYEKPVAENLGQFLRRFQVQLR